MTLNSASLASIRLVLPVKALTKAKSRLSTDGAARRIAAEFMFKRTLRIATASLDPRQVVVVTSDATVAKHARNSGAQVWRDSVADLNPALRLALAELRSFDSRSTLVVLVVDLPRLHVAQLRLALAEAATSRVPLHVADHRGTGTTFVSIPPDTDLPMVFGEDSAARFAELGSVQMAGAPPGLRTDLDTPDDPFQLDLPDPRGSR